MITHGGKSYFIVDDHIGMWEAGPDYQANKYGAGFISCFYDFHKNLSPQQYVWPQEKFEMPTEQHLVEEVFEDGTDVAIFQPALLKDFFTHGFSSVSRQAALADKYPGRLIANGRFDPREGDAGFKQMERDIQEYGLTALKTYTAEWNGDSRGWKLSDPETFRFLRRAQDLGVNKVHVHKGPTIWPLSLDAFDVRDVDVVASAFPEITFVVEHCGLPRMDEFCWIAAQEPNVYAGLTVVLPFIHTRPNYFARLLGELLFWLGEDRILYGSDWPIWRPEWLIRSFLDFDMAIAEDADYPALTEIAKRKILGLNTARLYDIEVPGWATQIDEDAPKFTETLEQAV